MNSTSTRFVPSSSASIFDPLHGIWDGSFNTNGNLSKNAEANPKVSLLFNFQSEDASVGQVGTSNKYDQEANKRVDRVQRRLAQNREAARKCRMRKKIYVHQLETSRLKLIQMEQELQQARQQGMYIGGVEAVTPGSSGTVNSGLAEFEIKYEQWVEVQNRQVSELRNALHAHISDIEMQMLVESSMSHYFELFRMKSSAAKVDIFHVMSGMWKSSVERIFLWIGGFRPSELLKVLLPHFDPMTDQQLLDVCNLKQSCQQAEDALSQGMEKLQQTLGESVAAGQLGEGTFMPQIATAMERLEALICFLNQADHLRQETLQQMYRILTLRQAARGLLALGEYFQRLRALSSLWATSPREPN